MLDFAMFANNAIQETELVDAAVEELRRRLPQAWTIGRGREVVSGPAPAQRLDGVIEFRAPNGTYTTFAVEAKRSFEPREVGQLLTGLSRTLRQIASNVPVLIVAPWLSLRTQQLLEDEGMNFVDLTGNVLVRLDNPAVYVRSSGSRRNPQPAPRGLARARGAKAARLIRLLADVRPPYGVMELATAARLAPGYVSRLLETLDRDALIERARRGPVEQVDVPGLLRSWAESYDVFRTNKAKTFLAPAGAGKALDQLRMTAAATRTVVTGSFAASRIAPVAGAALLAVYCDDSSEVIETLALIPADEGANVAVLRPFDPVVWDRTSTDAGLRYVAPSQVVVDCLTGTGRMPAEGEAVLAWMVENEESWRYESLAALAATTARV
jgi:hypothetical protein